MAASGLHCQAPESLTYVTHAQCNRMTAYGYVVIVLLGHTRKHGMGRTGTHAQLTKLCC